MRNAYALLGLSFLIVFGGAYLVFKEVHAPETLFEEDLREDSINPQNEEVINLIDAQMSLQLTAPAFADGSKIPSKFTCDGENVNPELSISGVPEGTESFVLVMDDPDIPESVKNQLNITKFNHWVLYNVKADVRTIPENGSVGTEGKTTRGTTGYVGSCPPDSEHRYYFRLYALPTMLSFDAVPNLDEVEEKAKSIALDSTTLMGTYERK